MADRKTNWFAIWISIAVVVVLALVAGLVVWMNSAASAPGDAPEASNINTETGAIIVGDADSANVVSTYIDFMCPVCNQFEQIYGPTIESLVDDGTASLEVHPISILDRVSQGTQFSTRSASAAYCVAVADADAILPFVQTMFANQPDEGTAGLTDAQMLEIAAGVGVDGIDECVTSGRYMDYVTEITEKTPVQPGAAGIGTPTMLLNGEIVSLTGDPQADLVDQLQ